MSLETWLDAPIQNEALPMGLSRIALISSESSDASPARPSRLPLTGRAGSFSPMRSSTSIRPSMSIAGSDSSMGSVQSHRSMFSQRSHDSRGSRRGRKQWRRNPSAGGTPNRTYDPPHVPPSRPYYCTWPDCTTTFKTRSEWTRHEEAVHYFPHRWVCCHKPTGNQTLPVCFICGTRNVSLAHLVNHLTECKEKPEEERIFWRSDQLAQHFKRIHGYALPKNIQQAWSSANPRFNESHLKCGFCGFPASSWKVRQDHVSWHLQGGALKDSWWPERKFMPLQHWNAISGHDMFVDPSAIRSWSCRYLESYRVLGETSCDLCGYCFGPGEDQEPHFNVHALRQCGQELYSDPDLFFRHLVESHGLGMEHNCRPYLWHHAVSLFYELREGKAAVKWQQSFEGPS